MAASSTAWRVTDRGLASIEFVLASALGLLLFVLLANVMVVQYGKGAVTSALNQAVREGSISGSTASCEARAKEVLGELLGGWMGQGVVVRCSLSAESLVVRADADFKSWIPLQPNFRFVAAARGTIESKP